MTSTEVTGANVCRVNAVGFWPFLTGFLTTFASTARKQKTYIYSVRKEKMESNLLPFTSLTITGLTSAATIFLRMTPGVRQSGSTAVRQSGGPAV